MSSLIFQRTTVTPTALKRTKKGEMRDEFDEARHSGTEDPMDSRVVEIDFGAMDSFDVKPQFLNIDNACEGLRVLAEYQIGHECDNISKRTFELIGRRVVAFWWVHLPMMFDGSPSLTSLAKRTNIDESGLSRITAQVSKAFGVHNRAQAHGDGVRK